VTPIVDEVPSKHAERPANIVPMALLFEGGLAVVAFALGGLQNPKLWNRIGWNSLDIGLGCLTTLPMLLGFLAMRRIHRGPLGRLNFVVDNLLVPLFARCMAWELALISIVAGIGEELLFRGVVQPLLINWLGIGAGLTSASVIFGLLHSITPAYAVLATAIGAYFGWLAIATGGLLAPIVAHALYDFLALAYLVYVAGRKNIARTIPPAA
jgi:hypothetical protein